MKERHTELEAQRQLFFSHSLIIRYGTTLLTVWFHTDIRVPGFFLGGSSPLRNGVTDW